MAIGVFAKKIKDIVDAELDSLTSTDCVADLNIEHAGLQLIKAAIEFEQLRHAEQQIDHVKAKELGLPIGVCFGSPNAPAKMNPAEMEMIGEAVTDALVILMIILRNDKRQHLPKYQAAYAWVLEVQLMMSELYIWQSMNIRPHINPIVGDYRPVPRWDLLTFFRADPEKVLDSGIDHICALSGQNKACTNDSIQKLVAQLAVDNSLIKNFYLLNAIKLLLPDDLLVTQSVNNFFKLVSKCIPADWAVA